MNTGMRSGVAIIACMMGLSASATRPLDDISREDITAMCVQRSGTGSQGEWGATAEGIRCRLIPVSSVTGLDTMGSAGVVNQFERPEEITFVIELQNVSDRSFGVIDTRYGVSTGKAMGSEDPEHLWPFLFAFDVRDGLNRPIDEPKQYMTDYTIRDMISSGGLKLSVLLPGQSVRVLVRPATWRLWLGMGMTAGEYDVIVRYRVPRASVPTVAALADAWVGEVRSAPVRITLLRGSQQRESVLAWGPEWRGLQAACEFVPPVLEWRRGDKIDLRVHLRNVGATPIHLTNDSVLRSVRAIALSDKGYEMRAGRIVTSGGIYMVHYIVEPGQEAVLKAQALEVGTHDVKLSWTDTLVGEVLVCPPGIYRIRFEIGLGMDRVKDAHGTTVVPMDLDWVGTLETGITTITIR